MNASRPRTGVVLVTLVLATVAIQIVASILLKELADAHGAMPRLWLVLVLGLVAGLNGLRFFVWGYTHKHYPLSHSYPLTALFFPCILLLSAYYGDPIGLPEIVGVIVIMLGVVTMHWEQSDHV